MNAVTLIAEVIRLFFSFSLLLLLLFLLLALPPLPLPKNAARARGDPASAVSDSCVVVPRSVEISAVRARGAREGPGGGEEAEEEGDEASAVAAPTTTGRAVAHASSSVLIPPAPPLPLPPAEENLLHGGSSLARTPRVTKAPYEGARYACAAETDSDDSGGGRASSSSSGGGGGGGGGGEGGGGVEGLCHCCWCRGRLLFPLAAAAGLLSTAKSPGQAAAAHRVSWEPLARAEDDDDAALSFPPFPLPLPLPIPPSLPLNEAEVPEALSQETDGRTSVATAAKGESRKPRKLLSLMVLLGQRGPAVAAVASPSFFLLLPPGATRSVAEASTRRGTLLGMSGTIVHERARRQETWALPREADAEMAGEAKAAAEEVEGADAVVAAADEDGFVAAERGFFRASSNASPTLRSRHELSPSCTPFRRCPEG